MQKPKNKGPGMGHDSIHLKKNLIKPLNIYISNLRNNPLTKQKKRDRINNGEYSKQIK